jgi:hypothetical protein
MSEKVANKILEGLQEALAIAKGEKQAPRVTVFAENGTKKVIENK